VTSDNLVAFVDQNRRIETEGVDASCDRPHLDPAMLARIARISTDGVDRNERQFSDALGAFGRLFVTPSPGAVALVSVAQTPCDVAVRFVRRRGVSAEGFRLLYVPRLICLNHDDLQARRPFPTERLERQHGEDFTRAGGKKIDPY
jgi:hypothetical protein